MPFLSPALASPTPADFNPKPGEWVAEEKYDGHRLIVCVGSGPKSLFDKVAVTAWSRDGKVRALPTHVRESLMELPEGTYDGELMVPGSRSYGVTEKANQAFLKYIIFDVLELLGRDLTSAGVRATYDERMTALTEIFAVDSEDNRGAVTLSDGNNVRDLYHVKQLATSVWKYDGEGLILKRRTSLYHVGKRTKDWLKIKQLRSAVLTLVGYQGGKCGPQSVWVLRDPEGNETAVKWKNQALLLEINKAPATFLGRQVRIEYQERTPDGSYRHPRFDRWEDE